MNFVPQPEVTELTGLAAWLAWDCAVQALDAQPIQLYSLQPLHTESTRRAIERAASNEVSHA